MATAAYFAPTMYMGQTLKEVVASLTARVIQFDGPPTFHIGATQYVTLCSHGIKKDGELTPYFIWQEAIELYAAQLGKMVAESNGKQLAWRHRPVLECRSLVKYRVYSRLAFI